MEASPRDRIWGIGMGKSNPDAEMSCEVAGNEFPGLFLTEVRDLLLEKEEEETDEEE